MKEIAVVVLNWNGISLLEKFLPSIVRYSPEATVFVADNASTDGSVLYVESNFPSVRIVKNKANYGYAKGYNEALKSIDALYLVLINSDVEVSENWLLPAVEILKNQDKTAIVQPKILDYKDKNKFEYAGAAGGFIDKFGYPYCRGRVFETLEADNRQYNDVCDIKWASGACLFIKNTVFKELKGFDNDFFAHQEEIDLCWRATNKGYKIQYTPKSVVYHLGGATLQYGSTRKTFLNFRNSLWLLTKNLPAKKLFSVLLTRMILDGIAGMHFIFKGSWLHCIAIIRAHGSFYATFYKTLQKRDSKQETNYYTQKSVVWQYFVQHCKVFKK